VGKETMMFQPKKSVPEEELVDFEEQVEIFEKMVSDLTEKRLMFVRALGGRGKTCLLRLMRRHCRNQDISYCWVDFRGKSYDSSHLTLAHEICDQFGIPPRHLAEALLPLSARGTTAGEVSAHIEGDVIGSKVITQILASVDLRDKALHQDYMKERLKRAFAADLGTLVKEKKLAVCFLDSFEDVTPEAESWLLEALLCPIRERELQGVVVVTGGQRWPKINDWEWEDSAHLIKELPPLSVEHIKAYAEKIQVRISHEEAEFCWRLCRGGIPIFMGMVVKNLRATVEVRP
jgi:hypothetical protein